METVHFGTIIFTGTKGHCAFGRRAPQALGTIAVLGRSREGLTCRDLVECLTSAGIKAANLSAAVLHRLKRAGIVGHPHGTSRRYVLITHPRIRTT